MRALLKSCAHRFVFPLVEALWATLFATVGYMYRFALREWTTSGQERVLVLAPHPDDESLGCGGTMALHASAGDAVCLVIATDGGSSRAGSRSRSQMAGIRAQRLKLRRKCWRQEEFCNWGLPRDITWNPICRLGSRILSVTLSPPHLYHLVHRLPPRARESGVCARQGSGSSQVHKCNSKNI